LLTAFSLVFFVSPEKNTTLLLWKHRLISDEFTERCKSDHKRVFKCLQQAHEQVSHSCCGTQFLRFLLNSLRQLLKTVHVAISGLRKPCPDGTSGICGPCQSTRFELENISAKSVTFFMEVQRNVLVTLNLSNWCCFSKTPASFSPELQIFGPIRCKLFSWAPNVWTNQKVHG
jgi:hypothetical protein